MMPLTIDVAQIAIISYLESSSEDEVLLAVQRAGMQPHAISWNAPTERLADFAGFIIVGGLSSENGERAGVIAAFDPMMRAIKEQSALGKPVLGIGNGAQFLVEAGLVPGLKHYPLAMALTDNKRVAEGVVSGTGFYHALVHIRLSDHYQLNAFTQCLKPNDVLEMPFAHAEGRFIIPPVLLDEMQNNGQLVFQYCDTKGAIIDEFPINPSGSQCNIAAVSNKMGNVMAMMPHPELTSQGDAIFQSIRQYIEKGYVQQVNPMYYKARIHPLTTYNAAPEIRQLIVQPAVIDHHATAVSNTLHQHGITAHLKRLVHWEISVDSDETFQAVLASGVLFDAPRDVLTMNAVKQLSAPLILVQAKDDMIGLQAMQRLKNEFGITGVLHLRHGRLWQLDSAQSVESVINSHLLFNPYAQDGYRYQ